MKLTNVRNNIRYYSIIRAVIDPNIKSTVMLIPNSSISNLVADSVKYAVKDSIGDDIWFFISEFSAEVYGADE
jgi:hypothetical protein